MSSTSFDGERIASSLPGHVNAIHNLVNQIEALPLLRRGPFGECVPEMHADCARKEMILRINDENLLLFCSE